MPQSAFMRSFNVSVLNSFNFYEWNANLHLFDAHALLHSPHCRLCSGCFPNQTAASLSSFDPTSRARVWAGSRGKRQTHNRPSEHVASTTMSAQRRPGCGSIARRTFSALASCAESHVTLWSRQGAGEVQEACPLLHEGMDGPAVHSSLSGS